MRCTDAAVLLSAGLDSAVLAAAEARFARVHPVYIATGLPWEHDERSALPALLATPPFTDLAPLVTLTFPVADVYPPSNWAMRGEIPGFDAGDADVYLPGRNLALLSKAAIHCARHQIARIVLGPLAGNSFPDATPEFFAAISQALSLGLAHPMRVETPFARMRKSDVIQLGRELGVAFELTLSCLSPSRGLHCGQCSKCRERRDAFSDAHVADPTTYAVAPVR